jgi:hypothetical protein
MCKRGPIQPYLGYEVRRKHNKENKRIILQLGNNMGGYLFLLFLGLNKFCNIFFPFLLLTKKYGFNIIDFILFC